MKQLEHIRLVQFYLMEREDIAIDWVTGLFGPNGSGKSAVLDAVQIALVCKAQAEAVAEAFVAGRTPAAGPILGSIDVRGTGKLKIKPTSCPVMAIARPLDNASVTFSWLRLPSEIARSTGGPLIVIVRVALPLPASLVAVIAAENSPASVGVPVIRPPVPSMVKPGGSEDAFHEVGELVAAG